jgi:superfamily II DNA/RNA helicase
MPGDRRLVHCSIGRTGRAGKTGTAHTFFTANDKPRSGELVNVLREASQVRLVYVLASHTT